MSVIYVRENMFKIKLKIFYDFLSNSFSPFCIELTLSMPLCCCTIFKALAYLYWVAFSVQTETETLLNVLVIIGEYTNKKWQLHCHGSVHLTEPQQCVAVYCIVLFIANHFFYRFDRMLALCFLLELHSCSRANRVRLTQATIQLHRGFQ